MVIAYLRENKRHSQSGYDNLTYHLRANVVTNDAAVPSKNYAATIRTLLGPLPRGARSRYRMNPAHPRAQLPTTSQPQMVGIRGPNIGIILFLIKLLLVL